MSRLIFKNTEQDGAANGPRTELHRAHVLRGDAQSLTGRHLYKSEWPSYRVLRPMIFCDDCFRTDIVQRNAGYEIAMDYELITKTMLSSICQICDF